VAIVRRRTDAFDQGRRLLLPSRPQSSSAPQGDVARRIHVYRPRDVPADLWESQLRGFVVPAVAAAKPVGTASMQQFARVLTLISAWCVEQAIPLEVDSVLDPDTVERFCAAGLKHLSSRATYRAVLRRLGRELTTSAPWEPRPEPIPRRQVARPYSPAEMLAVVEDASRQSSASKRRAALTLIALGAGAGLDGRWVASVKRSAVIRRGPVVGVEVGPPRPRRIPVLERYAELLLDLTADHDEGYLIGGTSTHRNRLSRFIAILERGKGHPRLSVTRLRSTWIVEHLRRGTRLPELLEAAGTSRIESFDALVGFVEPMAAEDAAAMLRGRS
jgi:integrase